MLSNNYVQDLSRSTKERMNIKLQFEGVIAPIAYEKLKVK